VAQPGEMSAAAAALAARYADMTPAAFAGACREFIRDYGTLPQPLPNLRRDALRAIRAEAADNGQKIRWVAALYGFSPNRFSRLTSAKAVAA